MTGRLGPTYRLQLGPGFGFDDAAALVPYLASLGVDCLYCSPVAEAVPGSTHGYDGTDPTRLRAELGGEAAFGRLGNALADADLGCVLDVVPNHLSTWPGGPWWREVLRLGESCDAAAIFDVDWRAGSGKVTLPLLDRPLPDALASGGVRLAWADGGERVLRVGDAELPISGGEPRGDDAPAEVLAAQHYRLVDWHDRSDRNYRRFFDVDGLVGVRVERPEVFEITHSLVAELVASGVVTALRVDHVDGLARPGEYLERLRELTGGIPVVVEKILGEDEDLRDTWSVAGTTGYEVLDDIGGALVDPAGLDALARAASREGEPAVDDCARAGRELVASTSFAGTLRRIARALGIEPAALADVTTALPVYRTYLGDGAAHPDDSAALATASVGHEDVRRALLDPGRRRATVEWQQLTSAVAAKGVEDTAWYRLPGRLAFCEVGGAPGRARAGGVVRLHERATARAVSRRAGLVPSTTHDTKRSGDARARLYALGERAADFERGLARFRALLADEGGPVRSLPPGETRAAAQVILSVLPADRGAHGEDLAGRVGQALTKGAREAKLATSWDEPDRSYESALLALAGAALRDGARTVHEAFGALVDDVARLGATLSLSAVVLRCALPGIPDCYQGDEDWNLSLVDPDNRRPVDFAELARRLDALGLEHAPAPAGLAETCRQRWRTGDVKRLVTAACMRAHRLAPGALAPGAAHVPVPAIGRAADRVLAWARMGGGSAALAVVTRRPGGLDCADDDLPAGARSYAATTLEVPRSARGSFVDVLTGRSVDGAGGMLDLAGLLAELPVALLVRA